MKFALSTGAITGSILHIKRANINERNRSVEIYDTKNKSRYSAYLNSKLFPDLSFLNRFKPDDYIFYTDTLLTHRILAYHTQPIYDELFNRGLVRDDWKNKICGIIKIF